MHIYSHWQGLKYKHNKLTVGLGNFDGVHIGHQQLISEVTELANEIGGTPAVITFHPHPMAVLQPESCPHFLLTQELKQEFIARLKVEVLMQLPFDQSFAKISPEDFIREILYEGLDARGVVVGYNFAFGQFGRGTPDLLKKRASQYNYKLKIVPPVKVEQKVVSSTLIRELLIKGQVAEAAKFLGYYPFVEGPVVSGERRGGLLGYPTANLNVEHNILIPANGVYSVNAQIDGETHLGVANIGIKPTFQSSTRNIEVHLLDFRKDLYGKIINVKFIKYLREEKKFLSPADLVKQIEQDILTTRLVINDK